MKLIKDEECSDLFEATINIRKLDRHGESLIAIANLQGNSRHFYI